MNCIIGADKTNCKLLEEFVEKSISLNLAGTFSDPVSVRNQLSNNQDIKLVILDTEMPELDVFDLIGSLTYRPNIILVSEGDQNAVKAFDFNVVDYLVKPISFSRFCKAIDKAGKYYSGTDPNSSAANEIFIKKGYSLVRVIYNDIIYIEALENYVTLNTKDEKFTIHYTMKGLENQLPAGLFIRVHRSFIVNRSMVKTINDSSLDVIVGNKLVNIPIGNSFKEQLLKSISVMDR